MLTYMHNVQHKVFVVPIASLENAVFSHSPTSTSHANVDAISNRSIKAKRRSVDEPPGTAWVGLPDAEELDVPLGCSVKGMTSRHDETRVFIHVVGYTLAGRIYKYQFRTDETATHASGHTGSHTTGAHALAGSSTEPYGTLSIWRESVVNGFEPDRWLVEQHWVPNPSDGVKIPMYMIRERHHQKSCDSFCLLYGSALPAH